MPNWCQNSVTLRHADAAMIARAAEGFAKGEFLQTFLPCPEALLNTDSIYYPDSMQDEKAAHDLKESINFKNYGFRNWYDWKVANWGTKWDIGEEDGLTRVNDHELSLAFDSAWSPPIGAYEQLLDLGFEIEAFYYESGQAFCGSWADGNQESYDIPGTAAEAEQVIPDYIDDIFDIVNSMAMWEEEEAQ